MKEPTSTKTVDIQPAALLEIRPPTHTHTHMHTYTRTEEFHTYILSINTIKQTSKQINKQKELMVIHRCT